MKQKIAVLFGGKSGEHEVSLQSAASIVKNLDPSRYEIVLIGIAQNGRWYLQDPPPTAEEVPNALSIREDEHRRVAALPEGGLLCGGEELDIDVVFPVLHGPFGEDGTVQGLLDVADLPYVGAGVLGSALGMDKEMAKVLWKAHGLSVVPFIRIDKRDFASEEAVGAAVGEVTVAGTSAFEHLREQCSSSFGYPLFVKPARVGSSVGISKVEDAEALARALEEALSFDTKALVEPAVTGQEVECSVRGNHHPVASTPGEIIPHGGFYDYEAKYVDPDGAELVIPARLDRSITTAVQERARQAYEALGLAGMARVDFFIQEDGTILLNELNTIPGFTRISMFPVLFAEDGVEYATLLDELIELARARHSERSALRTSY
jgi:D-alanine-D-alanine ligase